MYVAREHHTYENSKLFEVFVWFVWPSCTWYSFSFSSLFHQLTVR
jgi:hypothetical protein